MIKSSENRNRVRKGKKCVLLSDGTLRGFKVDGLFFHATFLFILDPVKKDISDRCPTTTKSELGREKSKI